MNGQMSFDGDEEEDENGNSDDDSRELSRRRDEDTAKDAGKGVDDKGWMLKALSAVPLFGLWTDNDIPRLYGATHAEWETLRRRGSQFREDRYLLAERVFGDDGEMLKAPTYKDGVRGRDAGMSRLTPRGREAKLAGHIERLK